MESNQIESLSRLTNEFSKLPGVGKKTAERFAYHIIKISADAAKNFADSIINVKEKVRFCEVCGNYTEASVCKICRQRPASTICVVKDPKDLMAIERTGGYNGGYHVLHGVISPLAGMGPNDIRIKELLSRLDEGKTSEVILATNPDVEGEATAMYLAKLIKPLGIKITRIAQGVSLGSELEFADEVTLSRALADRREV